MKTGKVMRKNQIKKQKNPREAWWVLEGDWGGQVYATIPSHLTGLSFDMLVAELRYIDAQEWPVNSGEGIRCYLQRAKLGEKIPGGMGGGVCKEDVWVHPNLSLHLQFSIPRRLASGATCEVCGRREPFRNPETSERLFFEFLSNKPKKLELGELAGWFERHVEVNQSRVVRRKFYCPDHHPPETQRRSR